MKKNILFLQGPHGPFLYNLRKSFIEKGHNVYKINFCGGDTLFYYDKNTFLFSGKISKWCLYIKDFLIEKKIDKIILYGDWRPFHREAIEIAKFLGISVYVFEEGYLRPNYITLEYDGVNGKSDLPKSKFEIDTISKNIENDFIYNDNGNDLTKLKIIYALIYYLGNMLFLPYFWRYKNHRPYHVLKEIFGYFKRSLVLKRNNKEARRITNKIYNKELSYFLFPLQLDTDAQIRIYSPFNGMLDGIVYVLKSFAECSNKDDYLLIRNHPYDNGLIDYKNYVYNLAKAYDVEEKVFFVDGGNSKKMIQNSKGVIVVNSTIGLTSLMMDKPTFCLGQSIYAIKGISDNNQDNCLNMFWKFPQKPDRELLYKFLNILNQKALCFGNFYEKHQFNDLTARCIEKIIKK